MAEEEKKQFVLNKKQGGDSPKNQPKSEVSSANSAIGASRGKKKIIRKKIHVGSAGDSRAGDVAENPAEKRDEAVQKPIPRQAPEQQRGEFPPKPQNSGAATTGADKPKPRVLEYQTQRPNVKAGNLSDRGRGGYGQRGGYGGNRGGYGQNGGFNRSGGQGGFNGNQARENYQRNGGQGGFNRGGFNRNGGQQGGFNRGGQGGRPGFAPRAGYAPQGGRPGFGPRPGFGGASAIPAQGAGKKQFNAKKKQQTYGQRKDKEELFDEEELYRKKQAAQASVVPKSIDIMETISVSDLAKKMNLKAGDIIAKLMGMGMMVTINQSIDSDTATILASEYGCEVHLISLYDETVIESDRGDENTYEVRPPIVTVMGHVDHGKTKTLDAIRKTNVAAGEAGGITQKIGAYQVRTEKGTITFLDTPGHEAFTMMRARGAQITDIVVLVVAADDGVMPQTLEALSHAKDAKVPIIVAVNKVDKPDANPDRVMTQLSEQGLTPEEWGGDTQYVKISALKGMGIDDLLDAILLQAEILELKAPTDTRAEGKVIESRVDQGRGVVASVVVQSGTLKIGDPIVAGIYSGRVRAMFNDRGERVSEALPSMPVEVLGLEAMPNAGDPIQVTESEKDARAISTKRQELKRFEAAKSVKKTSLDTLYSDIAASEMKEFKVIIKADLQGSAEALKASLEKLSTPEIRLVVIHSSAGAINESDVTLAAADENAIIIGFNVRPTPKAKLLADAEKVEIRKYNVIYKCVEEITAAMEGMLKPDTKEEVTGSVEVRQTYRVPKVGVIAGCYVTDGVVRRTSSVNLIRDGIVKFTGKIGSLKRFKDDVKEVAYGFECGISLENWQDIQVGDTLEVFEYVEVARKLGDSIAQAKAKEAEAAENPVEEA